MHLRQSISSAGEPTEDFVLTSDTKDAFCASTGRHVSDTAHFDAVDFGLRIVAAVLRGPQLRPVGCCFPQWTPPYRMSIDTPYYQDNVIIFD